MWLQLSHMETRLCQEYGTPKAMYKKPQAMTVTCFVKMTHQFCNKWITYYENDGSLTAEEEVQILTKICE